MPKGLDHFKEFFKDYKDNYIVIGGTACEEHFAAEGIQFRATATKDIDIVLIVEAYTPEYIQKFWEYISEGKYEIKEKEATNRKYFRFKNPESEDFPKIIELFSKKPDMIEESPGMSITPIPAGGDITSLSAILLDEEYYDYLKNNSTINDSFHFASLQALICLKAKAYLNYTDDKNKGEKIDDNDIKKHKKDVFRLATLLTGESRFELPNKLKEDMKKFMEEMNDNPVDFKGLSESMQQPLNGDKLTELLNKSFGLVTRIA